VEKPAVTIVDDDATFCFHVSRVLQHAGHAVIVERDEAAGLARCQDAGAGVLLLDARKESAVSALRMVDRVRAVEQLARLPIIVCSPDWQYLGAHGSYLRQQGCVLMGQPFDAGKLLGLIDQVTTSRFLGHIALDEHSHLYA
jgi:DNA-binding response OmpR family regulator